MTRRTARGGRRTQGLLAAGAALAVVTFGRPAVGPDAVETAAADPQDPATSAIADVVRSAMADDGLRAVIVEVTRGDRTVISQAFGTSMDGVPATTDMHFRNGSVAFAYLGTLLMQFVDEGRVSLDDRVDRWMPTLPEADQVTLRMLANQTTGCPDFETDPAWNAAWSADPFHIWTFEERLGYAFSRPVQFAPGTNWSYAHTNFMILGEILAQIGGTPLDTLLSEKVLGPMGLTETTETVTSEIPDPVLHFYDSERRVTFGIPAGTAFSEDATFWNSQWGTPMGANQATTIGDMITTAAAVGTGSLLSDAAYHAMTDPDLLGFGHADPVCAPSCFTQIDAYNFGLGVVRAGDWILQDPQLTGFSATEAYLPSQGIAIAMDAEGNYANSADALFRSIGAVVAPDDAPPTGPGG